MKVILSTRSNLGRERRVWAVLRVLRFWQGYGGLFRRVSPLVMGISLRWVMRPGRAGRSSACSRAACTALRGDLIGVFVRIVDTILESVGLVR